MGPGQLADTVRDSLSAITDIQEALHRCSDVTSPTQEDFTKVRAWCNSLESLRDIVVASVDRMERKVAA
jgi:hypothetical protein